MKEILIGSKGQYATIVDDIDYDFLIQWKWQFKISDRTHGRKVYARRGVWIDGRSVSVYMHDIILARMGVARPSSNHTADHANRDSLYNIRTNLRYLCVGKQNLNREVTTWLERHVRRVEASRSPEYQSIPF